MKNRIVKILSLSMLCLVLSLTAEPVNAQCPMCRMAVQSNLENGGTAGKGLNKGILYLLATPYFLIGTVGVLWYFNRKKEEDEPEEIAEMNN